MTSASFAQGNANRLPFEDQSFDLVVGSPPYAEARDYIEDGRNLGIALDARGWVSWMLKVTAEALRVSRGPVIWVASGVTRNRDYWPTCEGLMWRWFDEGWTERGPGTADGSAYRPCYWNRIGIPGSGGDQWYRADVEYAMCFKRSGKLEYANPKANGHAPKWAPGGEMSNRTANGSRASDRKHTKRRKSGIYEEQGYTVPSVANPGNLLKASVGGGHLGHKLAHENEAPFPIEVPAFFIRSHCPPAGIVLDPFIGSGSTAHAALNHGRSAIGVDLRMSQARLGRRRCASVTPGFAFAEELESIES